MPPKDAGKGKGAKGKDAKVRATVIVPPGAGDSTAKCGWCACLEEFVGSFPAPPYPPPCLPRLLSAGSKGGRRRPLNPEP
jgi:hypothetical protein